MKQTIYISLLNEGVPCWRPVEATLKRDDVYTITGENTSKEDEHWEFSTGDNVRCRLYTFSDGQVGLQAVAKTEE